MELRNLKNYIADISNNDIQMTDQRVAEFGVYDTLEKQLVSLTCNRVWKGLRLMETTSELYRRYIGIYLYILNNYDLSGKEEEYYNKLVELHETNLAFEKDNPPINYEFSGKSKANKLPRKRREKQTEIPGFDKTLRAKESLKQKVAQFGTLTFKIVPKK